MGRPYALLMLSMACHGPLVPDDTGAPPGGCTDLSCDGWPDIVVSANPGTVFWGSEHGFAEDRSSGVPTVMARGSTLADLDGDGDLDLVVSRMMVEPREDPAEEERETESYVFTTVSTDPWEHTVSALPTVGAHGVAVADLDADGFMDLVFANIGEVGGLGHEVPSTVFWGSEAGYSPAVRSDIPTVGAYGVSAADLDGDGYGELVFSSYYDGETRYLDSLVYSGAEERFAHRTLTRLPTTGARGNTVADLDRDGYLDLVFACHYDGETMALDSWIYWGSESGHHADDRTALPTVGAYSVAAEDLDGDGWPDLVLTQQRGTVTWEWYPPVVVVWNEAGHFDMGAALELPAEAASGLTVGDLDLDGDPDLAWSNFKAEPSSLTIALGDGDRGFELLPSLQVSGESADAVTAFSLERMY